MFITFSCLRVWNCVLSCVFKFFQYQSSDWPSKPPPPQWCKLGGEGTVLGYHFSGISGNLDMSGNSAKFRETLGKRPKVGESQGVCVVMEIWLWQHKKMLITKLCCELWCAMDTFWYQHITYLYLIRTVIHFSYAMFTENRPGCFFCLDLVKLCITHFILLKLVCGFMYSGDCRRPEPISENHWLWDESFGSIGHRLRRLARRLRRCLISSHNLYFQVGILVAL